MTLAPLPIYPSTQARKGFSASQLAHFHSNLSNALAEVISLPPAKRDTPSTRAFVSSYASDAAQQTLEALIWEDSQPAKQDDRLRQRVLLLAEKVASTAPGLELKTLLDLCITFPLKITRLRSTLFAALSGSPDLPAMFASDIVPAFTLQLSLSQSSGLYGLRKTTRCLVCLLRPSPPNLIRPFAHSKEFVVTLARAYNDGLTAISRSYGGIRLGIVDRELDHWEKLWLDTKVDIVDAFHLIVMTMIQDLSSASGRDLAVEADRTFDVVFALLEIVSQSQSVAAVESADAPMVPFLNRPLVADYQYVYELSKTLSSALHHGSRDDERMEFLESTLRCLDAGQSGGDTKDPGALKLLLRSSGIAPRTLDKVIQAAPPTSTINKGKAKATTAESTPPPDLDLDLQVAQVLDIFPDQSPEYVRQLLTHPHFPFRGSAEQVIEALLEGTVPDEHALRDRISEEISIKVSTEAPIERRNAFDQDIMDLSRVHLGKKTQDTLTRDRAEIERMKAEILRQVEAMSEDSDEGDGGPTALDVIDLDDDLNEEDRVIKVLGDGEDSGDEEISGERRLDPIKPEMILELAYIRDPRLFDRDAGTRRSKSRIDLKQQTGWTDEQIEGWRIMLERNPKKERILQQHEFSGNRTIDIRGPGGPGDRPGGGQRGGGRGGGRARGREASRGRGRGGGIGGRSGPGEKNDEVARERALKEKHKSSNRRRGHDKKMAKTGAGPSV